MKTVYSLLYGMLFLLSSCGQLREQDEYNTVRTAVYTNSYDANGRLSKVVIKQQSRYLDKLGYLWEPVNVTVQRYNYPDIDTYIITETNDLFPNEISTTIIGETFEKSYTLKNNDTIKIHVRTYTDATKSKPLLERDKYKFSSFPIDDYEENVNTETLYYYDENGNQTKIIENDFNSGETIETHRFKDLQYEQAIKAIPKSKNKLKIICYSEEINADTTTTIYRVDNNISYYVKQYVDNGKTIKATFDENQKLQDKTTSYTADGLDIEIRELIDNENVLIDSTYCKGGKEVKYVNIFSESKSVTTSEYDEKGNIILKIEKSKSDIEVSDEELDEMIQRCKESPKTVQ